MRSVKPVVKVAAKAVAATAVFLVLGNLLILAASWWAQGATSSTQVDDVAGISNLTAVDSHLWRGGAPTVEGYRSLAAAGVTTVVDLRAEEGLEADKALVTELGMRLVSIPVRDGQAPSADKVARVPRRYPMTRTAPSSSTAGRAWAAPAPWWAPTWWPGAAWAAAPPSCRNLAVGPPSLEQLAFVVGMDQDDIDKPGPLLTAVSRVLDAPRRLWTYVN